MELQGLPAGNFPTKILSNIIRVNATINSDKPNLFTGITFTIYKNKRVVSSHINVLYELVTWYKFSQTEYPWNTNLVEDKKGKK